MRSALIVDDDRLIHHRLRRDFQELQLRILSAYSSSEAIQAVRQQRPDVVLLDVLLPDGTGLEAFRSLHAIDPKLPVIFITADGESTTAIEAMRLGAFDYLLKPLDSQQVRQLVRRALGLRQLMETPVEWNTGSSTPTTQKSLLIGRCAAMQEVYKAVGRVAAQDVTVLIEGESGTGKELVARAIYQHSRRSDAPFLAINCAAIPESLLESELFGHEKGAFTGADRRRIGKFEQCSGGTLFLDEIGDMAASTQSKILRVLQEQRFERVGGTETITADVRIITATHHHLEQRVRQGSFRRDLYYRLNVFTIPLPPLRERKEDLPLLLEYFLARFSEEMGKDVHGIAPDALELLCQYSWPGNIREMQSALKHAILHCTGHVVVPEFLPDFLQIGAQPLPSKAPQPSSTPQALKIFGQWEELIEERLGAGTTDLYREAIDRIERHLLTRVLQFTGGNQVEAARILGITRSTLRNKIRALQIGIQKTVSAPLAKKRETSLARGDRCRSAG